MWVPTNLSGNPKGHPVRESKEEESVVQSLEYGKAEGEALAWWPAQAGTCLVMGMRTVFMKNRAVAYKGTLDQVSMTPKNSSRGEAGVSTQGSPEV